MYIREIELQCAARTWLSRWEAMHPLEARSADTRSPIVSSSALAAVTGLHAGVRWDACASMCPMVRYRPITRDWCSAMTVYGSRISARRMARSWPVRGLARLPWPMAMCSFWVPRSACIGTIGRCWGPTWRISHSLTYVAIWSRFRRHSARRCRRAFVMRAALQMHLCRFMSQGGMPAIGCGWQEQSICTPNDLAGSSPSETSRIAAR